MNPIITMLFAIISLFSLTVLLFPTNRKRGIVYFDIDDTLTTMTPEDKESVINYCIDKGYEVGIITASDRPIESLGTRNGSTSLTCPSWMPHKLYTCMENVDFETYNSQSLTSGLLISFPSFGDDIYSVGRKKGWQMILGASILGYMPSQTFLFDDNKDVITGASEINRYGKFIHVNNNIDKTTLSLENIKNII
jgi:hypothetical protein